MKLSGRRPSLTASACRFNFKFSGHLCLLAVLLACFLPSLSHARSLARGSRPNGITTVLPVHLRARRTTVPPAPTTAAPSAATTQDSDDPQPGDGDDESGRKAWFQTVLRSTVSAVLLRGGAGGRRRRPVSGYAGDAFRGFLRGVAGIVKQQAVLPITYHNGPIMYSPINVYMIYYGTWSDTTGIATVTSFLNSLSASAAPASTSGPPTVAQWWAINNKYYDGSKRNVTLQVGRGLSESRFSCLLGAMRQSFRRGPSGAVLPSGCGATVAVHTC